MPHPYFKELVVAPIQQSIIILDIDGTLLADNEEILDAQTTQVVKQLVAQGNQIYLVSNGFSHNKERNTSIASGLGVTFFPTEYKKPLKISVLPIIAAATKPVIVIGDKFLTDGLLAVNLGVPFVEVRSLRSGKEPAYSKVAYALDAMIKGAIGSLAAGPYYRDELYGEAPNNVLTILSHVPLTLLNLHEATIDSLKGNVKNILFALTRNPNYRTIGGPQSVLESLKKGILEIHAAHLCNPWQHQVTPTVGVVAGVDTLRFALEQKRKGFIKTIVAGPNIVVAPTDENNLIKNPLIDKVVIPSEWNKKWWLTFDQLFDSKAVVWASGVDDLGAEKNPRPHIGHSFLSRQESDLSSTRSNGEIVRDGQLDGSAKVISKSGPVPKGSGSFAQSRRYADEQREPLSVSPSRLVSEANESRTREEAMAYVRSGVCIIYSKNADEKLFNKLIEILWTYKLPIVVSHYGQFRQEEYFRLLKKARMLVYLSTHESQGIALNEAWMAGVPTLVWNRGFFQYQDKRFEDDSVGAPYLSPECGLSFKDDSDFERKLIEFLEKYDSFHPREYSLAHFTNAIAARKYLDIIESVSTK
jgi:predicted HAD superfamily phosphohydrolase YqeG/glycosyltransferase involved in cell wall biosynthesis